MHGISLQTTFGGERGERLILGGNYERDDTHTGLKKNNARRIVGNSGSKQNFFHCKSEVKKNQFKQISRKTDSIPSREM